MGVQYYRIGFAASFIDCQIGLAHGYSRSVGVNDVYRDRQRAGYITVAAYDMAYGRRIVATVAILRSGYGYRLCRIPIACHKSKRW